MFQTSSAKIVFLFTVLSTILAGNTLAANWKKLTPTNSPSARLAPMMAYDPTSQKIVLFGGVSATAYLNDTWTFDGADWTKVTPSVAPPARTSGNMTYDYATHKLVLFGGYAGNGHYLNDTWLWDGAAMQWIQTAPQASPTAVTAPLVFTDPKTGHAITWGGFDGNRYQNITWLWTGTTWRNLHILTSPFARSCSTVGFDPIAKSVVVFSGLGDGNIYDTWTWDGTSWMSQRPPSEPPYRYCGAAAYDPAMAGVISFGGGIGGPDLNDTWLWSGGNWTQINANNKPPVRESAGIAFDPRIGHVVVFGGVLNSKTLLNDTWAFLP